MSATHVTTLVVTPNPRLKPMGRIEGGPGFQNLGTQWILSYILRLLKLTSAKIGTTEEFCV